MSTTSLKGHASHLSAVLNERGIEAFEARFGDTKYEWGKGGSTTQLEIVPGESCT